MKEEDFFLLTLANPAQSNKQTNQKKKEMKGNANHVQSDEHHVVERHIDHGSKSRDNERRHDNVLEGKRVMRLREKKKLRQGKKGSITLFKPNLSLQIFFEDRVIVKPCRKMGGEGGLE